MKISMWYSFIPLQFKFIIMDQYVSSHIHKFTTHDYDHVSFSLVSNHCLVTQPRYLKIFLMLYGTMVLIYAAKTYISIPHFIFLTYVIPLLGKCLSLDLIYTFTKEKKIYQLDKLLSKYLRCLQYCIDLFPLINNCFAIQSA